MFATILAFAVAGVLFIIALLCIAVEWQRIQHEAWSYQRGYDDGFAGAPALGRPTLTEGEHREYMRGRRAGWKHRVNEMQKRRAA